MPEIITPKPTKGTGILRFSEGIYLKFEYDLESDDSYAIAGYLHIGDDTITLLPEVN